MASIGQRLKYLFTGKEPAKQAEPVGRPVQRVDAAQTDDSNKRHFAGADHLSADAAYNAGTRQILVNRSRYETLNNCYAKGANRSAADDMIGTGPRLQLTIPNDEDGKIAEVVEDSWQRWMDETLYAIKLRTAHKSYERDGGCFGIFDTNERLRHPVKFDTRWVEVEQCATPFEQMTNAFIRDGVEFDAAGNPLRFYFLKYHPGSLIYAGAQELKFYTVPAENVIHWYCMDRFGQHREIPETTPSLPLYSQLRRYTLATLTAAEVAAMLAGIMETMATPGDDSPPTSVDSWEMFEMVRGTMMALPKGWKATQFKPEQPTATHGEFKRELLNECGRSMGQPLNVVTGNSSGYNYSSGRLDHVPYQRSVRIKRNDLRLLGLDKVFRDGWLPEALLVGEVPREAAPSNTWKWSWVWDGFDSIDPYKDAMTDDIRLLNGTSSLAEIAAEYNQDWRQLMRQRAAEQAYAKKLGIVLPQPQNTMPPGSSPQDAAAAAMIEVGIKPATAEEAIAIFRNEYPGLSRRFSRNGSHR